MIDGNRRANRAHKERNNNRLNAVAIAILIGFLTHGGCSLAHPPYCFRYVPILVLEINSTF